MKSSQEDSLDCRLLPASFEDRKCVDIGLLALATDHAIESEVRRILSSDELCLHVSRLASSNTVNMENLAGIAEGIEAACSLLLPETALSVIAYGCTSGTVAAGEARILETLKRLRPGCRATTPITAARAAFDALKVSKLAVLTPYPREVHLAVVNHLKGHGLDIVQSAYLGVSEDIRITEITSGSLEAAVDELSGESGAAIFVSCTALRVVANIARLERRSGKPIVTSNQALAWHCLRLSGLDVKVQGHGRLFEV
jgi:maleate isomerase